MLEIVGDSHIIALIDAVPHLRKKSQFQSRHGEIRMAQLGHGYHFLQPFFASIDGNIEFTQDVAKNIFQKLNADGLPYIEKNDARRFVFVFGFYPSFCINAEHWLAHTTAIWDSQRQFVTQAAFTAIIDEALKQPMMFFEHLLDMNVRFSVASCCPVPASYHRIARKMNLVDNELALIYSRFLRYAADKFDRLEIPYHLPPAEIYDKNGAMWDLFAKSPGDYHANAAYGRLMLTKILQDLDQLS